MIDCDEDRARMYGLGGGLAGSVVTGLVRDNGEVGGSSSSRGETSSPNSSVSGRGGGRSTIASRSWIMKMKNSV